MALNPTGDRNAWGALRRVMDKSWFGIDVSGRAKPPLALNNEWVTGVSADGTTEINMIRVNASNQVELGGGSAVNAVFLTVTLAQLNAGQVVVPAVTGKSITPISFRLKFTGNFATSTTIRLSTTDASPVDIATIAIANATDGNIFSSGSAQTGLTIGAGLNAAGTAGQGIQLREVGTAATGGTSIDVTVQYLLS